VRTNIRAANSKKTASFHWLESWGEDQVGPSGEPTGMTITIPDWLYAGIVERGGVLTIHQDYFLLTGGIERWLYRVVRKHAGKQTLGWHFTMEQLHEKSGSTARLSDFAVDIRKVVAANEMPEYDLSILRSREGEDIVYFTHLSNLPEGHPRLEREHQRFLTKYGPAVSEESEPVLSESTGD
jgi:plasmid replication initiation protein